jgi:murein DD-endopeptidase MepM/ murein hydrolase activator NlpD
MFIKANGLDPDEFQSWVFCPGMLFLSTDKWWGDRGRRDFPHEGIDFCLYRNRSGKTLRVDQQTRIPVMHDGVVRAMFTDYLGEAVIIEHENGQSGNKKILSVYAHTKPQEEVQPGAQVKKGDIIATIADTKHSKARILPHLHLSLAIPAPDLSYENFVWNIMRDPARITLIGPLNLIKADYHVPDEDGLNQQIVDSHSIRS